MNAHENIKTNSHPFFKHSSQKKYILLSKSEVHRRSITEVDDLMFTDNRKSHNHGKIEASILFLSLFFYKKIK